MIDKQIFFIIKKFSILIFISIAKLGRHRFPGGQHFSLHLNLSRLEHYLVIRTDQGPPPACSRSFWFLTAAVLPVRVGFCIR